MQLQRKMIKEEKKKQMQATFTVKLSIITSLILGMGRQKRGAVDEVKKEKKIQCKTHKTGEAI